MRMYVVAVCLLVGACLRAAEPAPDPVKEHREKMQGDWAAIELDGAGQNVPKDAKEFRLLFKGDTVTFDRGGEKKEYRFRLQRVPNSTALVLAAGASQLFVVAGFSLREPLRGVDAASAD